MSSLDNVIRFPRNASTDVKQGNVEMSPEDKSVIEQFANGASEMRDAAIEAHRRYLASIGPRANEHMRFMAEVDTPVPDLLLRASYRKDLLKLSGQEVA